MRKLLTALVLTTAVCLALAAVAAADPGDVQESGQSATTSQGAGAASGATQVDPSNTNISIRVLSPGDDGDVSQSNTAGSSASAGNQAGTTQTADQGNGGSGIQTSQQDATTDQLAFAISTAEQVGASNVNTPIRVLSPGSDGDVNQSNTVGSQASAGNAATTSQSASQGQSGSSCGCDGSGSGIETSKQSAGTEQGAGALSSATQQDPSNTNVSIRVLSPGGNGSVSQSNTAGSSAAAGNTASTTQGAGQSSGTPAPLSTAADAAPAETTAPAADAAPVSAPSTDQSNTAGSSASAGNQASTSQDSSQGSSGSPIQVGDQSAATGQLAGASSTAEQDHPSNTAASIRVLSPGHDGSVTQSNTVGSSASAGNSATTQQSATQSASGSCGCSPSSAIQVAGQDSSTYQGSLADSSAEQFGASNTASPVRVLSPGGGGDVTQSNTVGSSAVSGNAASTTQTIGQQAAGGCGCGSGAIQVAGQQADTEQGSLALSKAVQAFGRRDGCGCEGGGASGNDASPVRVWSPGSDGSVTQANTVGSSAASGNRAATTQDAGQGAGGSAIQVAGQKASTGQLSFAASLAAQLGASNTADPVRVKSPGGGGSVSQQNTAGSSAMSGNAATTAQTGVQYAGGRECGCLLPPIQVLGQSAETDQLSAALSAVLQHDPTNDSSPVRVWSPDTRKAVVPAS